MFPWYDSRWCSVMSSSVYSRSPLFITGEGCLVTPATSRRRELGWPVNACRAVATAFAWLTSRLGWRLVLLLSGFLLQIQDCGRPGLAAKGSRLGQRGGVYRELGVWACGAGQQRVHDSRPLSIGFIQPLYRGQVTLSPEGSPKKGLV